MNAHEERDDEPTEEVELAEGAAPAFGDPRAVVLRWRVPDDCHGLRADLYLTRKVRRISRSKAARLIKRGDFRLAAGPLKASSKVSRGEAVELWRLPPDSAEGAPEPGVIFEDEDLLVLDKPPDLAVHPSARYLYRTVTAWLRARAGDGPAANPCHRLDRETSGVLLCAKSRAAERELKVAFADGRVKKTYLAITRGHVDEARHIDAPLALQGERGLVKIRMIVDEEGLPSATRVVPLAYDASVRRTLVRCHPLTGRQHQIRAHLAHDGAPLVADKLYAMGDEWFDAFTRSEVDASDPDLEHERHALHAAALEVELAGVRRRFAARLPDDLRALLPGLGDLDEVAGLGDPDDEGSR
jgi:23S rRNA pseudouridine1911/1915/1917 synthase